MWGGERGMRVEEMGEEKRGERGMRGGCRRDQSGRRRERKREMRRE